MKPHHFERSKLSKIMSFAAFKHWDKILQESQGFPDTSKVPTSKYFSGRGANLLTSVVVKYLKLIGGHAVRINSMGVPRKVRNGATIWTKGSSKGVADIQAIIEGVPYSIEIKYGTDKQSEAQKKYQKEVEQAGGQYLIVKKFDDLLNYLSNNLKTT